MFKRLFLSSVSDHPDRDNAAGHPLRGWLRDELEETDYDCICQELFIEQGTNTLRKIAEYIEHDSDIVIHLVCEGASGSIPDPRSVHSLLRDFEELRMKTGGRSLESMFPFLFEEDQVHRCISWQRLTYTQWEAWLARYFGKTLLIFQFDGRGIIPVPTSEVPSPYSLTEHLDLLQPEVGYPERWSSRDQLIAKLLKALRILERKDLRSRCQSDLWPRIDLSGCRKICNRGDELHAFAALLNSQSRINTIHLYGGSGSGKSTVLREMCRNVTEASGLLIVWLDLRLTRSLVAIAGELWSVIETVRGTLCNKGASKSKQPYYRASYALDQLQQLSRSTMIFVDSFDDDGDCSYWIEEELVPLVGRTSNLRLVVAGQKSLREQTQRQDSVRSWDLRPISSPMHWETYLLETGVSVPPRAALERIIRQFDGDPSRIDPEVRSWMGDKSDE